MKKMVLAILSVIMVTLLGVMTVGCGKEELNMGKECLKFDLQQTALTQLKEGTVDVAVIDSVMAGYYTSTDGDFGSLMIVPDLVLAEEQYGIAGRKEDKALMSHINQGLIELYNSGELQHIAERFGLEDILAINAATVDSFASESAGDTSFSEICNRGKIVIGWTDFEPIAFYDDYNNFTGFDTELARAVVNVWNQGSTSIEIEFYEILDWNTKEALLDAGTIDLIWNGLTITPERSAEMCISVPYLYNKQVAVIRSEDSQKYTDKESMSKAVIGVEGGSAGESVVVKKK
ncbi:MAG: transporter substrate-binding domain-containing protein [Clostridiales bacterium]|nr:transporter substrate-binding domain-containing protein [Clostridiales bacterium]